MRAGTVPDHGSLALLAKNQAAELRPLLFRVHVRNFVEAPRRDAAFLASFEAIALGLIPLVTDDVLVEVATLLRPIHDVPASIRVALDQRIGGGEPSLSSAQSSLDAGLDENPGDPDLHLAQDPAAQIPGADLARLVERAIADATLAGALLRRPEPTVFDRGALYRHADEADRQSIRADLASALAAIHLPGPTGTSTAARELIDIADHGHAQALIGALAGHLGVDPIPFDIARPVGQELTLFAMMALGLEEPERVRILLRLEEPLSRSVKGVFRLVALGRETPRAVAVFLAGYQAPAADRLRPSPQPEPTRAVGTLRADGRADPISRPRRVLRDRASIGRLDRRQ